MRTPITLLSSLVAVATAALVTTAAPQAADDGEHVSAEAVLAQLDWLAGDWTGEVWGGQYHAYYTTPEGGRVLSHSRLKHGDEESFYEFEVFEARGELVHLQPYPGGKRAGGFTLAAHDPAARSATFENPDKDWPTRIVYRRVSEDALLIVLSDPHGGSDKVERFELAREE